MKLPIAPESKSALTECTLLVSVVLILIERMIDVLWALRVLVKSCLGSFFPISASKIGLSCLEQRGGMRL